MGHRRMTFACHILLDVPLTAFVNIGDTNGPVTSTEGEFESHGSLLVLTINIQSARIANV